MSRDAFKCLQGRCSRDIIGTAKVTFWYDDERNPDWSNSVWPKRQEILLSAVEKVFNFNGLPDFTDRIFGNYTDQGRAFTRLLYYIHLLGDHIEYTASSYEKG